MLYDQYNRPIGCHSPIFLPDETVYFLDNDTNIRIKRGKFQLYNETNGKWYTLRCRSIEGIPNLFLNDIGDSTPS